MTDEAYGVDFEETRSAFLISMLVLGGYIFANVVLPIVLPFSSLFFTLGIPASVSTNKILGFITVVVIAPVAEEIFFVWVLKGLFVEQFEMNPLLDKFIRASIFSAFHFFVFTQGGYVSAITPFVGAFLFRLIADFVIDLSENLLSGIFLHSGLNAFLYLKGLFSNSVGLFG